MIGYLVDSRSEKRRERRYIRSGGIRIVLGKEGVGVGIAMRNEHERAGLDECCTV